MVVRMLPCLTVYVLFFSVHKLQEFAVHAGVFRKFRMECRGHRFTLAHQNRIVALASQHLDSRTDAFDLGSADKNHLQRILAERSGPLMDRTLELAPVGIAA